MLALAIILFVVASIFDRLGWSHFGLLELLIQSATFRMLVLLVNLLGISIGIISIARSKRNDRLGIAGVVLNVAVGIVILIAPALLVTGLLAYLFTHPVR